jgi:hypothetical protein
VVTFIRGRQIGWTERNSRSLHCAPPDLLWRLEALANFMRLSLLKAAHASVPIVCEYAPHAAGLPGYGGVTGAPGASFGMRKVYTNPNTMVVPLGWAFAWYSFSYLKNTFQSFLRSI